VCDVFRRLFPGSHCPRIQFELLSFIHFSSKIKVKQSLHRPGQAMMVPEVFGFQISKQSAHGGGKVVNRTHRPPLPHRKYSWHSFLLEDLSAVGRIMSITPSGKEPATFGPVASINCATACRSF